jgi:hypothetical protein
MAFTPEVFLMGVLVKTAERVENEVGRAREQFEPRLRVKLKRHEPIGLSSELGPKHLW